MGYFAVAIYGDFIRVLVSESSVFVAAIGVNELAGEVGEVPETDP